MATTEKMLTTGIMPGKDEMKKHIRPYEDPELILVETDPDHALLLQELSEA